MIAQNNASGQDLLDMLLSIRAAIPQPARRFSVVVRLIEHNLADPALVAFLRTELGLQANDPEADYGLVSKARQMLAGLDILPPVEAAPPPVEGDYIRLDPDLGRLAIGLNRGAELRLWAIARQRSTAQHGGRGWVTVEELRALSDEARPYSKRHLRRLLAGGHGVFWQYSGWRVYLAGVQKLAGALAQQAQAVNPALIATNIPGRMKDVYLPAGGTHEQWQALIYAGWLAAKNAPALSRATLQKLFNRTAETLARWERARLAGLVEVIPGYAQVDARDTLDPESGAQAVYVPEGAKAYAGPDGAVYLRWQIANTYSSTIKQHNHKGQQRKVRTAVFAACNQPPDVMAGGPPVKARRYFENRKALQRAIRRHGSSSPRLYFLGQDWRGRHIWEPTTTGYTRTAIARRWAAL